MSEQATRQPTLLRFPDKRQDPTPYDVGGGAVTAELVNFAGRVATNVLSHRELEDKLATLRDMQPQAPLSFLAVEVHGLSELRLSDWRRPSDILGILAHNLPGEIRVTDFVGRLGGSTIGVILQGSTTAQASKIIERLRTRLTRLSHTAPPIEITVSAASGRGINAQVLPNAAMSPLGEPC